MKTLIATIASALLAGASFSAMSSEQVDVYWTLGLPATTQTTIDVAISLADVPPVDEEVYSHLGLGHPDRRIAERDQAVSFDWTAPDYPFRGGS
jgi:hypothetical protein